VSDLNGYKGGIRYLGEQLLKGDELDLQMQLPGIPVSKIKQWKRLHTWP
jgi:hypothetical protein